MITAKDNANVKYKNISAIDNYSTKRYKVETLKYVQMPSDIELKKYAEFDMKTKIQRYVQTRMYKCEA